MVSQVIGLLAKSEVWSANSEASAVKSEVLFAKLVRLVKSEMLSSRSEVLTVKSELLLARSKSGLPGQRCG